MYTTKSSMFAAKVFALAKAETYALICKFLFYSFADVLNISRLRLLSFSRQNLKI